jgi:hypothetical protein
MPMPLEAITASGLNLTTLGSAISSECDGGALFILNGSVGEGSIAVVWLPRRAPMSLVHRLHTRSIHHYWPRLPDGTGNCFAGKAPSVQFPIHSFQVFVATACGLMEVSSLSIWLRVFCWRTIVSQIRTRQCQSIALAGEWTAGSTIEQQL